MGTNPRKFDAQAISDADEARTTDLTRQLEIAREALENIGQCNASMNGHIARSALAQIDVKS